MNNTYDLFKGDKLKIAEKIQQRRLQILIHSCLYYEFNTNVVADAVWDKWAKELVKLQSDYPDIAKQVMYAEAFKEFDGSTGFDLPIKDEWVCKKAMQIGKCGKKKEVARKPKKKGALF